MREFINPYNFIPFNSQNKAKATDKANDVVSGYIEYSLLTKTPLFIPNTSNDDIFDYKENTEINGDYHKSYEFFSYDNLSDINGNQDGKQPEQPVIPGSEIRGMFRANYEILTDSCLPFLDSDQLLHKRVSGFFKAGLIKKGEKENEYELFEAEDCLLRTKKENNLDTSDQTYKKGSSNSEKYGRKSYIQDKFKEGQKIYVSLFDFGNRSGKRLVEGISATPEEGYESGYIIKGMSGPEMKNKEGNYTEQNKHCAHVFLLKESKPKSVKYKKLDDTIKAYQSNDSKAYDEYKKEWEKYKGKAEKNTYFPVYYSEIIDNGKSIIYLSPASGTMETYNTTLEDIVGSKSSCKDVTDLCPTCSLFGMLNIGNKSSASKLRFSDLKLKSNKPKFEKKITLQELSSPKLQNMEFYIKRPSEDAQFWTYDYWVDKKGKVHFYNDNTPLELNGRKFYWHNDKLAVAAKEQTIRNTTIRPLSSGVLFSGRLYYKNISKTELKRLIWLLNCGEDNISIEKKAHGYKLGHAKPLGYGSISVSVNDVIIRSVKKEEEYIDIAFEQMNDYNCCKKELFDKGILENFEKMTSFDYLKENCPNISVSYPKVEGKEEVYEWFVQNHGRHIFYKKNRQGKVTPESFVFSTGRTSVMPQKREEMVFGQYMKPLSPQLQRVVDEINSNSCNNSYKKNNMERGKMYNVEITGYNKKGTSAYFSGENISGSIFFRNVGKKDIDSFTKEYYKSRTIKVKYLGKDENGYNQWEVID